MREWKLTTLGRVTTISSGSIPPGRKGAFNVMGANGRIGSAFEANFGPGYLVGRVGAVGAITRVVGSCWASDNTLTVVPNAAINEVFLGHMLTSLDLQRLATKTAQPLLTQSALRKRQISLPPLEDQRRIAEVLDTIEETIQASERVIAKRRALRAGLAADLLKDLSTVASPTTAELSDRSLASDSSHISRNRNVGSGRLRDLVDHITTKSVGRKPADSVYVGLEHIESGTRNLIGTAPSSVSNSTNGVFRKGDVSVRQIAAEPAESGPAWFWRLLLDRPTRAPA